ncbi:MAG: DNA repair protein RecN [Chloroflexi bacterium]|nr:DNA repair protein RecN [Chloroflexota bacterium]
MLLELSIRDLAIIDHLNVRLETGLNVLTGETGAGKSIVIDAVSALLGGRCDTEMVRDGAERARVEGIFALPNAKNPDSSPVRACLQEYGLDDGEDSVILSREIARSGRTIGRINGRAVPVNVLQQVARELVDIHGQSEHLSLLRVPRHVDLLDEYSGLMGARAEVASKVSRWREIKRQLQILLKDEREIARRLDLLRFQVDEIRSAALRVDEEQELESGRRVLANAETLIAAANQAYTALYEGQGRRQPVIELLGEAHARLAEIAALDQSMQDSAGTAETLLYQMEDLSRSIRAYRDRVEYDPARLQEIEERLDLISRLKRKYGSSVAEVLKFGQEAAVELDSLAHSEERVGELQEQEAGLLREIAELAEALSRARREAGHSLAQAMERELADLNMSGASFYVAVEQVEGSAGVRLPDGRCCSFDATGIDKVEFRIAPNPGESLRPLAKIASGGETARLMLALKTILSRVDPVPTLIFDEIDQGIGGRSGQMIGRKLCSLAFEHQVICVTHLPQITCFGDAHFSVSKRSSEDRTTVCILHLADGERVDELAAMLGGPVDSQGARQNALEMLAGARTWKNRAAQPPVPSPSQRQQPQSSFPLGESKPQSPLPLGEG